ncbi:MAG: PAS domain S-box protein [candidate division KSB1 bacterium]|nr:PAS domain S-box protein [candidate division KSB1 bacterium]
MEKESEVLAGRSAGVQTWKQTLAQLRPVLDAMQVAAVALRRGRVVFRNPEAQHLLNGCFAKNGRQSQSFLSIVRPGDRQTVEHWFAQLKVHSGPVGGPLQVMGDGGAPTRVRATFAAVGERGEELVVGTLVPEGTKTTGALHGQELYRLILDSVNDGIVMSQNHRFVFFNARFAEMLGYQPDELMRMDYRELHTERGMEILSKRALARERGEQVPARYETTFRRKDGTELEVEVNVAIVDHRGRPATFAVIRDISERQWMAKMHAAQLELALALSRATDLEECLRLSLEAALRLSDMECGGIYLLDEATGGLQLMYEKGLPQEFVARVRHYGPDCPNTHLVKQGKSIFTTYAELTRRMGTPSQVPLRAIAVVPMVHKGEVIGCINVASTSLDQVPLRARGALHLLSAQVGDAVARLKAEQTLHDREERLEAIVQGMSEGLVYCDAEGRIRFANRHFCQMTGYSVEELIGHKGIDLLLAHKGEQDAVREFLTACLQGQRAEHEVQLRKKSGERLWVRCAFAPLHDPHGQVMGTVALAVDITEQRRAMSVLSLLYNISSAGNSAITLHELFRAIHMALIECLDCTNLLVGLCDYQKGQIVFPYWVDERDSYEMPLPLSASESLSGRVVRSRTPLLVREADYDELVAKGELRCWGTKPKVWLGVPLQDGEEVIGLIAVQSYTDPFLYTERDVELLEVVSHQIASAIKHKRAEEELRRSEEKYRLLVENVNDAIVISQDDRFIFFNPQFARLLGYEPEELLNKDYRDVYTARGVQVLMERQRRRQAGEEVPSRYETTFRRKDGSEIEVEANVTIITYQGRLATFAVIRDISEQKKARAALERHAMLLQAAVEVGHVAASVLDPDVLTEQVVHLVRERFALYFVGLYLVDESGRWAVLRAATGQAGKALLAQGYKLPVDDTSMTGWCMAHAQVRVAQCTREDSVHLEHPLLPETRSEVALPLIARGRVIGAMSIQSQEVNAFSDNDLAVLKVMADQVAIAIANAELYKALAREQALMNALMDSIPDNIYFKDAESRFIRVSKSLLEKFGVQDPAQVLGKTDFDFFTEEHARQAYEDEQTIMRTGKPIVGSEEKETWPDGSVTWVRTSKLPLRDEEGHIVGTFGISSDITARRKAEQALAKERNLLRTIIDALPDCIFAKDGELRFTLNNTAHLHALGVQSQAEALGRTDFDFRPIQTAERYAAEDRMVLQSGQPLVNREEQTVLPNGELGWLLCTKVPLRDEEGRVIGLVGISRDISAQKMTQTALQASLREKEVLLKEIHHRVKNNMQVISSMLRLQSNYIEDPRTLELFNESQNRVRSMALIHEQLYRSDDLSRIDFGTYVRTLTSQVARSYESNASISLRVEVEGIALGVDTGIPCGLIINELVSNAFKHAFRGRERGTICVRMWRSATDIVLSVSDDGIGFPKEIDFRNTESLGLQLVTTLTDQLEGSIELKSEGQGTEFVITFPAHDAGQ